MDNKGTVMLKNGIEATPIATLKDGCGGISHIIEVITAMFWSTVRLREDLQQ